jgi:hypothetical protein
MATPLSNLVPHNNLGNSPPRLRNHNGKGKGRGTKRSRLFSFPDLNDPITLRPGQHARYRGGTFFYPSRTNPNHRHSNHTVYPTITNRNNTPPKIGYVICVHPITSHRVRRVLMSSITATSRLNLTSRTQSQFNGKKKSMSE